MTIRNARLVLFVVTRVNLRTKRILPELILNEQPANHASQIANTRTVCSELYKLLS